MLIYNAVVHPMDAPTLPTGFVEWAEGKILRVGPMPQCPPPLETDLDAGAAICSRALSTPTAIWGCWQTV